MSVLDIGLLVVMLVAVAAIGYALGRRARVSDSVRTASPTPPVEAEADTDSKADAKAKANANANADADAKAEAKAKAKAKADAKAEADAKADADAKAVADALDELPVMNPSDAEDELEVTKVGQAATAPPPSVKRTVYHPLLLPIVFDDDAEQPEDTATTMFLVHATAQTDTGLRRKHNEDSLLVFDKANLFVVADGMGGYKGGRLASQLVINTMEEAAKSGEYEGPPHEEVPAEASELARAIQMANAEIQETVGRKPDLEGMGTTVCAARFSANKSRLYIGHVGDSRCYRLRDGVFTMMTNDHTMAEHGVKGPESAHLSRAVGIWPTVPIDLIMAKPQTGDAYLICSDGLTKMLDDDVIANVLRTEDHPKAAVDRLVLFANSRGGKDNITVILVRVVPPHWKPRSPSSTELVPPDSP